MITATGKTFIKRYLAGHAGSVVGAISVGIGNQAAALNDSRMQFEFARVPVGVIDYDFVNDVLVFKGTLDETVGGTIHEIGLWSDEVNPSAGNQESRVVTTFDSDTEDWGASTFNATNTRIGNDSLRHTPAANGTSSSVLTNLTMDFMDNSSQDTFVVAYFVGNANTSSIRIRFRTDASNYYEYTITSPTAGYKFSSFQKGSATVTGTPSWADINEVEVRTSATAGGSASVDFDGIRIEDVDTVAPSYGLIARFIPATPIVKAEGIIQDIEYALPVNV